MKKGGKSGPAQKVPEKTTPVVEAKTQPVKSEAKADKKGGSKKK